MDEWAESIKDWADLLVMDVYDFMKDEEHRAFMLLLNLPNDPFWLNIYHRYPLCLEDGQWNPKYYYNGKWRMTLEALRDRMAVDLNQFMETPQTTQTQTLSNSPPPLLVPSGEVGNPATSTSGDEDCQVIFEYPARKRRSFEYEWRRFTNRMRQFDHQ